MINQRLLHRAAKVVCVSSIILTAVMAPATAAGKKHATSLPDGKGGEARHSEHRKEEVLQGAVFALLSQRHCDDVEISLPRLSSLLKANGFKPDDLGPSSRHGQGLDRFMKDASELFFESPRRACEIASNLIGEDGEIADLAVPESPPR